MSAQRKKNVSLWGSPENPDEDQPARASTVPELDRLLWALMLCLTQPEARRPDRQGDSWPHTQHFGHAMVLCRHLILTLVFRYLNLDIISILHTAGYSKHKTELLLPHGCQACSWHGVTPSGWEKPSWPLMPRPNLSAAWAQIHTVTLSMSPMSKKGLSGPGPRAHIWGLPSPYAPNPHHGLNFPVAPPVPGALLWNPFLGETHEPDNTTPPFPQNDPKLLGAGTNPQRGILVHST